MAAAPLDPADNLNLIRYRATPGVRPEQVAGRPVLIYGAGGRVAVDETMLRLWQGADGKTLAQLLREYEPDTLSRDALSAALACLSEAGLLLREGPRQTFVYPPPPVPAEPAGLVSVIILAYNGTDWLKDCLPSVFSQTYPDLEVIVVDNASTDLGMGEWVRQYYPLAKLLRLDQPMSFAAANNYGAEQATGDYLFLLNQDTRLDPAAVAEMVSAARANPSCGAVAAKLRLWWAPKFLNGLGNYVGERSWGSDLGYGLLDLGQLDEWTRVPSACFAAALIPRAVWQDTGPMDPGFTYYYEDAEWCYRATVLGYSIVAAPRAVVYHAFGGRVPTGQTGGLSAAKQRYASYGRLRFAKQVVSGEMSLRFLKNYRAEDRHSFLAALRHGRVKSALAVLGAGLDIYRSRRAIEQMHNRIHARAKTLPEVVFALPANLPPNLEWNSLPRLTWNDIQTYYLPLLLQGRTRTMPEFENSQRRPNLLIVSNDVVNTKMAGPGIRYLEMAKALSKHLDVTLAVPGSTNLQVGEIRLVTYQENVPASLMVLVNNHDQALISGYMVIKFPQLKKTNTRLIVDWYDPLFLENLNYYIHDPLEAQDVHNRLAIKVMNQLAQIGDFFICGNERQRDLWMGMLAANGRVNPHTFLEDDSLRKLVDVVGVGFPERVPARKPYLRGVHPAFDADAQIVLWGGGIWNWLDPLTLVKAWPQVVARHPKARLVYLGTRHPNPAVPKHEIVDELIALAEQTGEKERSIFFIEWVGFEERETLLTEATIGVTLHPIHIETRYSIRTRVLDYFWARLPTLITRGDVTSEWIEQYNVGRTVPPRDVDATATALNEMLDQPAGSWDAGFDRIHREMTWENVTRPLVEFCYRGVHAPDRAALQNEQIPQNSYEDIYQNIGGPVKKAAFLWATKGLKAAIDQTKFHLRFLLSRH
jgi:GT2 family glycosyltransferase/glycosyltransferase involved in cell wall biosynthesis